MDTIEVESLHSDAQIRQELETMVGRKGLTLRAFVSLHLAGSPYTEGGSLSPDDVAFASSVIGLKDGMTMEEAHTEIESELDCVARAYEILPKKNDAPDASQVEMFSPEWLCDTIAMACNAVPSLTWEDAMDGLPMVAVVHLGMSAARASGAKTCRPLDFKAAFEKMRKEKDKNG